MIATTTEHTTTAGSAPEAGSSEQPGAAAPAESTPATPGRPIPRWVVLLMTVLTIASVIGTALSPYLLVQSPLLLVLLSPDLLHIVLAAPQTPFVALLLVGTGRRVVAMVATWALLAHFGPAGVEWAVQRWPRLDRLFRWFERVFRRFGAPLLVVAPSYGTAALAGVTRMPWRSFFGPMLAGQTAFTAGLMLFGESTAAFIEPILAFITAYVWECTAVMICVVALQRLYARWRRRPTIMTAGS